MCLGVVAVGVLSVCTAVGQTRGDVSRWVSCMGVTMHTLPPNAPHSIIRCTTHAPHTQQVPEQLERLFQKNYDLLLSIFNPEGWLEVTYVDDTHRIGRDDKGNVFYLHRC